MLGPLLPNTSVSLRFPYLFARSGPNSGALTVVKNVKSQKAFGLVYEGAIG
jgi:hypothetical protein